MSLPSIHPEVHRTPKGGVLYLQEPGCVMIAEPNVDLEGVREFLKGFDEDLNFPEYLNDPDKLPPAETLCKFAGQLCYLSFKEGRTWNAKASRYLRNIRISGHGSVLEHSCYSFLLYGTSRSVTHELVRHRAGVAFSQVSQRYVDGSALRFVERPEYLLSPMLHKSFIDRIEDAYQKYEMMAQHLAYIQKEELKDLPKTEQRKRVNQAARSLLPNETEAPIVASFNVRALRHVLEMRANPHAEVEVRRVAYAMYCCVKQQAPLLFEDYNVENLPDGTKALTTETRKV